MPRLLDLQRAFGAALLADKPGALSGVLEGDELPLDIRFGVYRNNVIGSLTGVLEDVFPVVRKLVDARFFEYAAQSFLRVSPPRRPCLHEYGGEFPLFLGEFPPCRHLVYLADVARLEWLLHRAAYAAEMPALNAAALSDVPEAHTPELVFRFHPSHGLLQSPWPIDRIWKCNSSDGEDGGAIDLDTGGVNLEVMRTEDGVVFRWLDSASFAFRSILQEGATLEAASTAAFEIDAQFDLATAVGAVFQDGLVTEIG